MKKLLKILMLGILAVFFTASIAGAYIRIMDTDSYWPTWYNNSPAPAGKLADDVRDQIGGPKVEYLDVYTIGGYLDKIEIKMSDPSTPTNYLPTALFIDSYGGDNIWDYYVESSTATTANLYYVTGLGISSLHPATATDPEGDWPSSTMYKNSSWGTYPYNPDNYREDHPAGIDATELPDAMTDGLSFYRYLSAPGILQYDFRDDLIDLSFYNWQIGFTEVCANDVIIGGGAPVPEPATLLLLGSGLIGLAGIGRRKVKKLLAHS